MKTKNNLSLGLFLSLLLFLNCACKDSLKHKNVKEIMTSVDSLNQNGIFSLSQFNKIVKIQERIFYQYSFTSYFKGYWNIYQDTLFYIGNNYVKHPNAQGIPILVLNAQKGTTYSYYDYFYYPNSEKKHFNKEIKVTLIDKQYIEHDTIYTVKHSVMPLTRYSSYGTIDSVNCFFVERTLEISKKEGLLSLKDQKKGFCASKVNFLWGD